MSDDLAFVQGKFPEYNFYTTNNLPNDLDLSAYGDIIVAFEDVSNLDLNSENPYDVEDFYDMYYPAISYTDAQYRTQLGIMSGDITPQEHLPTYSDLVLHEESYYRIETSVYILSNEGNYLGYLINGEDPYFIYYNGGYSSLKEVSAYLLGFGEVPPNSHYDKGSKGKREAIEKWGIYGRVNYGYFSGDVNKYPYEPLLRNVSSIEYSETDFGSIGGFEVSGDTQDVYNDGVRIDRSTCRFVFVSDNSIKDPTLRSVFYTYNHYNDFQEYLNYDDIYGYIFGNLTSGNQYNTKNPEFVVSPSPEVYFISLTSFISSLI